MERIFNRVEYLLSEGRTVWMYVEGDNFAINSIEKRGGKYFCKDREGKEYEMLSDEDMYETVNYCAPLFHD